MEKKELKAKNIPMGYPLCFNDDCAKKDTCMHYQARLLMPKEQFYGQAVYPIAWQDGECHFYHEKKLVKKAWGFSKLYNNVPKHQRAEARQYVSSLFGRGNGIYYRIHHGENMISPKRQAEIMDILKSYGSIEGIKFDHYVTDWDLDL
jgi:hypothetical protein